MGEYDNWGRDVPSPRSGIGPGIKWGLAAVCVVVAVAVGGSYMGMLGGVATAPSRVISRTMDTDNIIRNYEWFHDANNGIKARVGQILDMDAQVAEAAKDGDKREMARLRVDLGATRQSCRDLVAQYNANATKTNRAIFMGREAPESQDPGVCER